MDYQILQKNDSDVISMRGFVHYIFYPHGGLDKTQTIQRAGFTIKTKNFGTVRCFGNTPYIQIGDYFEIDGYFDNSRCLQVKSMVRVDDDYQGATSMLLFCFGPKTSANIIHEYNDDSLFAWDQFKNHTDCFIDKAQKIKGLGLKKINKAIEKYESHMAVDVLFQRFNKYGMTLNSALFIYEKWGVGTLKKIDENPYALISLHKLSFSIIDRIALNYYKIETTDIRRLYAGIFSVMYSLNSKGHDFIRLSKTTPQDPLCLIDEVSRILKIDKAYVREGIFDCINNKGLILDKQGFYDIVYLPSFYQAEKGIASFVKSLVGISNISDDFIINSIEKYESEKGFSLAEKQKQAVFTAVKNKFSIISGPPGSGKTTIVDCIKNILKEAEPGINIQLAAPTGKAAKRMTESTGMNAKTVHRLLMYSPQDGEFLYNQNNPIPADVLIIDEFSMMPLILTYQFLQAIPHECRVIFVGDKNQLPSVDAGRVLGDLLNVPNIPKVILEEVYRQGKDSTILQRALDMSMNKLPDLSDSKDFTFWEADNVHELQEGVLNLYYEECKKYGIENVMFLTPMNKYELGVNTLNEIIQEKLNPHKQGQPEVHTGKRYFRLNDRVIQLTNEEEFEVYNGMVGTIIEIIPEDKTLDIKETIVVDYGDIICEYNRDRYENIKLAYTLTIHKSQGSEAQSVIMICHSSQQFMLTKKLIYTGMTRAKTHLHMVGQKYMVNRALTKEEPPRNSKLTYWCTH